ncbi:MAG: hypothetical protein IPN08_10110 [Bacteroidales bacterium]|nr:hypothetical protein [Bacteroidales bacterium]
MNYSGCLMENVNSLAGAGQWGYSTGWQNNFVTARNWTTSGGKPRMDITAFSKDHALSPLLSDKMLRRQIQAHRYLYQQNFGSSPNYSKGYWPAECSFSVRNIKALKEEGLDWVVIANSHLARTLNDYPLNYGTSGCNIDPPNGADKVTTNGNHWWNGQIDGRGGTFAAPYCYQAHKAKYVDPETGTEYKITVVPMDDVLSYQNGYATMGTGTIDASIAPYDDPAHPSMVLLAHDGDNAWGGGYDYYAASVPNFANEAASKGYVPSTIEQFLASHPVPESDVVHVEDGSWVNAANDWGHPQFINWLWPMYTSDYRFNPDGWTEDARNWAVLVAAENRVQMAEDLQGTVNIANIVNPSASANAAERAWHFLLPAYNSGYMYYGTSLDMEVKQSLACNRACTLANQVIAAHPGTDNTPPTVFVPQRYPYNPGGTGFGPNYSYQQHQNSSDFHVWTFAYDVSGVQTAVLKYRLDNDGTNQLSNNENETYAGGSGVGAWQSITMTYRNFPTGNVTGNPDINFFILPDYIAGEYYAEIAGIAEKLVDYYVEITDNEGNQSKTAIQHVYVGPSNTGGGSGQSGVYWTPANPTSNDIITITQTDVTVGANLHWGVKEGSLSWQTPDVAYWPAGSALFSPTGLSIESPMSGPDGEGNITIQLGPFNNPAQEVSMVDFVFHYSNNTWNNNNGADFHIPITQVPVEGFELTARNITQVAPDVLEFDIYLLNKNAAVPFELATTQLGITFDAGILNGAAQTSGMTTIVPGSSQLPVNMQPISVNTALPGLIRVAGRVAPGAGNGQILSSVAPGTRVVRLRMTNSVPFAAGSTPDMSFTASTATQPSYPTRVARYENNTNVQLVVTPGSNALIEENPVLNGSPSLSVTPAIQSVAPAAGVCDFVINSNAPWSVASNQSWCIVSPVSGFGNGILNVSFAENSGAVRSAAIAVNVAGLPETTVTVNQEGNPSKVLHLNVLLEGLYNGNGTMKQANDVNGPVFAPGISDVIDVELHNAADYSITEYTASAVPLSTSGVAVVNLPGSLNAGYYLTIKHRNSVTTTTANPVSFSGSDISYTFDQPSKAFGGNLLLMADGYYLIYAGDVNQDGFVDTGDTTPIDNDQFYFVSGYVVTDINGDGTVDTADGTFVDNNQFFFIGSILP